MIVDHTVLFAVSAAPALLFTQSPARGADTVAAMTRGTGLVVIRLRGVKMRSVARLYDETAAALQFPTYFGENWDAFEECLRDLDVPPAGMVLAITDAGDVLADAPSQELATLVSVLADAQAEYARPRMTPERELAAVPFHIVLQEISTNEDIMMQRWTAVGANFKCIGGAATS